MKILIVKRVTILFFLILIYLSFEVAACRVRVRESFDEGWQFHKGDIVIKRAVKAGRHGGLADADVRMVEGEEIIIAYTDGNKVVDYKASDWTSVNLPHDWLVEEPFVNDSTLGSQSSSNCYRPVGIGFYHKEFNIPIEDEGKRISVEFDGIFRNSTVWGNGHIKGNHPRGYLFTRNIVMALYQPISVTHWGAMVDYNIFTDPSTLKQLPQNETNKHFVYIPVIFLNLEKGNYKVDNDDSDVFRMGLLNPKMDELGVVSPHLRRLTKAPKMSLPVIKAGSNNNNLVYWFGWTVKSLETQGERSVTGMDAERGVYVVTLVAYEGPMKDFIQANDVVLKLGETDVNNLDDLQRAAKRVLPGKTQEMVVFRNQKENRINILSKK